jgi:hypothetical protein
MEIPGLGTVTKDTQLDWYYSEPMPVPVLGGKACRIVVGGEYDEDPNKGDYHRAISNFLQLQPAALMEAEPYAFRYYQNCNSNSESDDDEFVKIDSPGDVWRHVRLGIEPRAHAFNSGQAADRR